ncbi:MAG: hypothetical protein KGJ13_12630 [Patescibacteria group bacterium]|nr:hypothetical protein [Patescibacteria group bacterium]
MIREIGFFCIGLAAMVAIWYYDDSPRWFRFCADFAGITLLLAAIIIGFVGIGVHWRWQL